MTQSKHIHPRDIATRDYTPLEKSKQRNFLRMVNSHPSGAVATKVEAAHRRGFPDIIVHLPEIVEKEGEDDIPALSYYIEWKRAERSKIAAQQLVWKKRLESLGFIVSVHHNLGEAKDEFERLLLRPHNFNLGAGR